MKLEQVSRNCYAVLNEKNRLCDSNSGLINLGGGVVIDTQCDLTHARRMIELFGTVWADMPQRVINTHEDADHVWGNQLFPDAEIIAHRSVPERMQEVANPQELQRLLPAARNVLTRLLLRVTHPGVLAVGTQLLEDYDFSGIEMVPPTTLFDERYELDLGGTAVHLIYVGPAHQVGDTLVHVPEEGVLFAGDVLFHQCTPMGWTGSFANWFKALDLITELNPAVIVPGHGPVCGLETVAELRSYLEYVQTESRRCFDAGLTSQEAARQIDLGPYSEWRAPARLYMNVERAYREFRNEPFDSPWVKPKTFDTIHQLALSRGLDVEF